MPKQKKEQQEVVKKSWEQIRTTKFDIAKIRPHIEDTDNIIDRGGHIVTCGYDYNNNCWKTGLTEDEREYLERETGLDLNPKKYHPKILKNLINKDDIFKYSHPYYGQDIRSMVSFKRPETFFNLSNLIHYINYKFCVANNYIIEDVSVLKNYAYSSFIWYLANDDILGKAKIDSISKVLDIQSEILKILTIEQARILYTLLYNMTHEKLNNDSVKGNLLIYIDNNKDKLNEINNKINYIKDNNIRSEVEHYFIIMLSKGLIVTKGDTFYFNQKSLQSTEIEGSIEYLMKSENIVLLNEFRTIANKNIIVNKK